MWLAGAHAFDEFGEGWAFVGLVPDRRFGEFLDQAVAQEADGRADSFSRAFGEQGVAEVGFAQAAFEPLDGLCGECAGLAYAQEQFASGVAQGEQDPFRPR